MVLVNKSQYRDVLDRIKREANETGGCSVLLFVAPECDALCACHILTHLLRCEHVQYKIKPASGLNDLMQANRTLIPEMEDELRSIVLINCAGTFDVRRVFPKLFSSSEEERTNDDVSCYVLDAHRPIHLGNIYDKNDRVFVIDDMLETIRSDNLPEDGSELSASAWSSEGSSSSSASSSSEDEEPDDEAYENDSTGSRKRKRRERKKSSSSSSSAERKRHRTARRRALEEYYCSTCFGTATAMVAYEMSKEDGKDTNDLLWLAIVGLTSYYVRGDVDRSRYVQLLADVQIEVANKNGTGERTYMRVESKGEGEASSASASAPDDGTQVLRSSDGPSVTVPVADAEGRISLQFDYRFMLYRHWNLYESMLFSNYVSTAMKLWTSRGRADLEKFIAKIGIPLKECRQKFAYMSERLKGRLKTSAEDCSREFQLDEILFQTFSRQDGFSASVSASDLVHITTALLECETHVGMQQQKQQREETAEGRRSTRGGSASEADKTGTAADAADAETKGTTTTQFETTDNKRWVARFNLAYDSLRKNSRDAYQSGIACAKRLQKVVFQMASSVIERKQVRNSGPFRYTLLQNLTTSEAAYFVQPRVLAKLAKFIVTAFVAQKRWTDRRAKPYVMCVANEARGTHLVVGVMCPGRFEVQRNYLGKAFRYAAESVNATYKHDGFDTAAIELGRNASPTQFLSALHDRLSPLDD